MISVPDAVRGAFDYCQNCGHRPLEHIMNLGHHPPCDALLRHHQLRGPEAFYPLDLYRCGECGLVQINYAVEPEELCRKVSVPDFSGRTRESSLHDSGCAPHR